MTPRQAIPPGVESVRGRLGVDNAAGEMIQLGSFDTTVTQAQRAAYLQQATAISGGRGDLAAEGSDKLTFAPYAPEPQQPMTVADMQRALKSIGLFPGGKVATSGWTMRT